MGFEDQIASDQQLIQRCLSGEISAFRQLYEQHKEIMYNVALRILRSVPDAEDALQETFVKIYRSLPGFKGECKLSTWTYQILLNTCLSSLKQKKSSVARLISSSEFDLEKITETNEISDASIILEQEIGALPLGYRTVFVLHEVEGFAHEEIAAMLGTTEGTSKSQLFKAKKMLRKQLKPFFR